MWEIREIPWAYRREDEADLYVAADGREEERRSLIGTIEHEIGHCIGIYGNSVPGSIMNENEPVGTVLDSDRAIVTIMYAK